MRKIGSVTHDWLAHRSNMAAPSRHVDPVFRTSAEAARLAADKLAA